MINAEGKINRENALDKEEIRLIGCVTLVEREEILSMDSVCLVDDMRKYRSELVELKNKITKLEFFRKSIKDIKPILNLPRRVENGLSEEMEKHLLQEIEKDDLFSSEKGSNIDKIEKHIKEKIVETKDEIKDRKKEIKRAKQSLGAKISELKKNDKTSILDKITKLFGKEKKNLIYLEEEDFDTQQSKESFQSDCCKEEMKEDIDERLSKTKLNGVDVQQASKSEKSFQSYYSEEDRKKIKERIDRMKLDEVHVQQAGQETNKRIIKSL